MSNNIEKILEERGKTHGDFGELSDVSIKIKDTMRESPCYQNLSSMQKEALDVIATKMGRIVAGGNDHKDSWDDIQGYARLGGDSIIG